MKRFIALWITLFVILSTISTQNTTAAGKINETEAVNLKRLYTVFAYTRALDYLENEYIRDWDRRIEELKAVKRSSEAHTQHIEELSARVNRERVWIEKERALVEKLSALPGEQLVRKAPKGNAVHPLLAQVFHHYATIGAELATYYFEHAYGEVYEVVGYDTWTDAEVEQMKDVLKFVTNRIGDYFVKLPKEAQQSNNLLTRNLFQRAEAIQKEVAQTSVRIQTKEELRKYFEVRTVQGEREIKMKEDTPFDKLSAEMISIVTFMEGVYEQYSAVTEQLSSEKIDVLFSIETLTTENRAYFDYVMEVLYAIDPTWDSTASYNNKFDAFITWLEEDDQNVAEIESAVLKLKEGEADYLPNGDALIPYQVFESVPVYDYVVNADWLRLRQNYEAELVRQAKRQIPYSKWTTAQKREAVAQRDKQLAGLRAGLKEFQRISKVADAYVKTLDLKKYPATAQRHAQLLAMVRNGYAKVVESEKRIGKLHVKRAVRVLKYEEVEYILN
ncbi:MAG: hypothetical protein ACRC5C_01325, partial [Bacilli bacterium]